MAYITVPELRDYIGTVHNTQDTILQLMVDAAKEEIDGYMGRSFEPATTTRYFLSDPFSLNRYAPDVTGNPILYFREDLYTVTSVLDAAGVVISPSDYWLLPLDGPPWKAMRLKSGEDWAFTTDGRIAITGQWGAASSVPSVIKLCNMRLAAYYYRLRDASVYDVTSDPNTGQMIIPKGIPADVKVMLDKSGLKRKKMVFA